MSTKQKNGSTQSVLTSDVRIQDFQLREMIGCGGQAEVWKVTELSKPHRDVAAKLVTIPYVGRSEPANAAKLRAIQEQELGNWAKIREAHNVVPLYGPIEDRIQIDEHDYVVIGVKMPLADGDLANELQRRSDLLTLHGRKEIRQFLSGIAHGLKALHDVNIGHRDIKPENILLFREAQGIVPKLMDFGLSLSSALAVKDGQGTPEFMAPELFETGSSISIEALKHADVYALGVLFYYIYFGILPFSTDFNTTEERFERYSKLHKEQEPSFKRPAKIVDPELRQLIAEMLHKRNPRVELHTVITRLEAGLSTHVTADGQLQLTDVIRTDSYRWNPEVHKLLGNNLHYHLIKAVNPISDIDWLRNNLRDEGIRGFSVYRVLGGFDYLIRLWTKTTYEKRIERIMARFVEGNRSGHVHLRVRGFDLFQKSPKVKSRERDQILAEIAQCADATDEEAEKAALKKRKLILSSFGSYSSSKIRFFVTVSSPMSCPDKVLDLCLAQLRTELLVSSAHPEEASVYYGSGDVRGLLKFRIKNFHDYVEIVALLQKFAGETRSSADLRFDTFVELDRAALVESDDGSIPREVALHCADVHYEPRID